MNDVKREREGGEKGENKIFLSIKYFFIKIIKTRYIANSHYRPFTGDDDDNDDKYVVVVVVVV